MSFYVGRMWGGKRQGAGRNKRNSGEKTDWNMYKKEAKRKKLQEAAKSTMDLKNFFSAKPKCNERSGKDAAEAVDGVKDSDFDGNVEEDMKTSEDVVHQNNTPVQIPSHLPFFVNGCKAPGKLNFCGLLYLRPSMCFRMQQNELHVCPRYRVQLSRGH